MKCVQCDNYEDENDHPVIEFFNIFSIALCPMHLNRWRMRYLKCPEMARIEALKVEYNFVAYWMQRAPEESLIRQAVKIDKEIGEFNLRMVRIAEEYFDIRI